MSSTCGLDGPDGERCFVDAEAAINNTLAFLCLGAGLVATVGFHTSE